MSMPPASTAIVPVLQRGAMCGRIDAAGEPGGDDEALESELARKLAREFLPDGRAVAGADDGDDGDVGELELGP